MTSRFDDTITAIATSPISSGIGIIRISGPEAQKTLLRLMPTLPKELKPRRLYYGSIVHPDTATPLDVGYGVWMRGPHSFTGEDSAEIQAHGGALNLQRILEACLRAQCRHADPGEFTRRAFLNGKIDLSQAEAIQDIVNATSWAGLETAQSQHAGSLKQTVETLRTTILGITAHLEVNIDFVHEDVPLFGVHNIAARIEEARTAVRTLVATYDLGRVLRNGIVIALAGRPNTGKSSLFNAILRDDRSIVTEIAGTTRDYLEERSEIGGVPVVLVDTAGIRETNDPVEIQGVARTHQRLREADVVLIVHDGSLAPEADEVEWEPGAPSGQTVRVLNKKDLGTHPSWDTVFPNALRISATTGDGISELLHHVRTKAIGSSDHRSHRVIVTRSRHKEALLRCEEALSHALVAIDQGMPFEIVSGELQLALDAVGEIVGISTHEDILDRIFSEFCLGK